MPGADVLRGPFAVALYHVRSENGPSAVRAGGQHGALLPVLAEGAGAVGDRIRRQHAAVGLSGGIKQLNSVYVNFLMFYVNLYLTNINTRVILASVVNDKH